jgi:hypothetical protein
MVRFLPQESVKKGFAGRLGVAYMRLYRNEDSINFSKLFRVIEAQNPSTVRSLSRYRMPRLMA